MRFCGAQKAMPKRVMFAAFYPGFPLRAFQALRSNPGLARETLSEFICGASRVIQNEQQQILPAPLPCPVNV
jgi:hypothetical protein